MAGEDESYIVGRVEWNDPIQSRASCDCSFVAAMSSVAWTHPGVVAGSERKSRTEHGAVVRKFQFYNSKKDCWDYVDITKNIPLISPESSDRGETWPALLEKAYVKWRIETYDKKKTDKKKTDDKVDEEDYKRVFPTTCEQALDGLTPFQIDSNLMSELNEDSFFDLVKRNCLWVEPDRNSKGDWLVKVRNPIVAYTGPETKELSLDDFLEKGLIPSHAYSLLGYAWNDRMILRDPMGRGSETNKNRMLGWYDILGEADDKTNALNIKESDAVLSLSRWDMVSYFLSVVIAVDVDQPVTYSIDLR
ncbi:MAG: C2 family cysteine protease [Methanomassiliicoccales archaeon]|nr:C2 family cysteine protease [Methanomassiliicoccales archaeon]